jgi:phosphoglycolate phosphatase
LSALLIDLDGTLVDPGPGIIKGCQLALAALGRPIPAADKLHWVIGPPLRESFAKLLGGSDQAESALAHYRAYYSARGIFEASRYDGITEALTQMRENGHRLILCTSKPKRFAARVIEHFGFISFFEALHGSEFGGRHDDKGDLIQHILEAENLSAGDCCMIGDRFHDVRAANRHGIASIGVLWGYGPREELEDAGATRICERTCDLAGAVQTLMRPPASAPFETPAAR